MNDELDLVALASGLVIVDELAVGAVVSGQKVLAADPRESRRGGVVGGRLEHLTHDFMRALSGDILVWLP